MKRSITLLLIVAILLAAAGSGASYAYRWFVEAGKKYETVRIAEGLPAVQKLPHYLAAVKSLYTEQNVKIRPVDCSGDREALAALESGKADVALVGPSSLIFKKTSELKEGTGPVAFASLDRGTSYHLVAREDKPLADVQSLKNKTVISGPQDSMDTVFFENILRDAGISPYEAVTIITNIPDEIKMGALKAGTGHYLLLEEKDLPAALARGFFLAKSFKAEFPSFVCVANREFLRDHPEAIQRFTNALYMAQTWMRYHTAAEAAAAAGNIRGLDKGTLPSLVERYYKNVGLPDSPLPRGDKVDTVAKMLDRAREIPMPVKSGDLVTDQFAQISVKTVSYVPEDKQEKKGLQKLKFWD